MYYTRNIMVNCIILFSTDLLVELVLTLFICILLTWHLYIFWFQQAVSLDEELYSKKKGADRDVGTYMAPFALNI